MSKTDVSSDLHELERVLARTFPALTQIGPLELLDTGFGSLAVETAGGVIFRIGRHAEAADGHERERQLLPLIGPRLPLKVPQPAWCAAPGSPGLPFGAIGYRKLDGQPLDPAHLSKLGPERLATQLAEFLLALHGVATEQLEPVVGARDLRAEQERLRRAVLPTLREHLNNSELEIIERWWDRFLADPILDGAHRVLCHRDLWYGNLLVDEPAQALVAVVDWENATLADPAEDFAVQLYLGASFLAALLDTYRKRGGQVDDALKHRIARCWELREFIGIRLSIEMTDEAELTESIAKLRKGPILSARR